MTNEKIIDLFERQELLENITYEELKTLVLAYPYAQNLRVLLAAKSKQINHPDLQRNLALAATYSIDRKQLFQIMTQSEAVAMKVEEPEEVFMLKPIEQVQESLKARAPIEQQPILAPKEKPRLYPWSHNLPFRYSRLTKV